MSNSTLSIQDTAPVERPVQFDQPQFHVLMAEITPFIHLREARDNFSVTGNGLTAAVLDTGLRTTHVDFAGRVRAQRNFTADNGGNPNDATDGQGHGTNVSGIIAANGIHRGVAPGTDIIPLKVLTNTGSGSFEAIADALQWVLDHQAEHHISVACLSLGDSGNYTSDEIFADHRIRNLIRALNEARVAVVVAAGNDFFTHASAQGMSFPAICRETISVGAVYDSSMGSFSYQSGAVAHSTAAGQMTPFSQRLHESLSPAAFTDIFAPGAPVTSSGINSDHGESVQHGTSQAAPVASGVILLMQQFYLRHTNQLPPVNDLATWLRQGGVPIHDGDDEDDNVINTGLDFLRLDALAALEAVRRQLQIRLLREVRALRA
jgi:subtilisin family serine protease